MPIDEQKLIGCSVLKRMRQGVTGWAAFRVRLAS